MPIISDPTQLSTATESDWRVIFLVFAAATVGAMQIGKAPPAWPFIRNELGIGLVGAGWVVSAILMVGAVVGSTIGFLADRSSHERAKV